MKFQTRGEAIQRLIVEPLEASGETPGHYLVHDIADQVLGDYSQGYQQKVDDDEFWDIVSNRHIGGAPTTHGEETHQCHY